MRLVFECLAVSPTYVELIAKGGEGLHLDVNDTSGFKVGKTYEIHIDEVVGDGA